jgi:hypothetical protein
LMRAGHNSKPTTVSINAVSPRPVGPPGTGRDCASCGLRQCATILGTGNRAPVASHWS